MMPNEGRVAMLRALTEKQIVLCLFVKGPKPQEEFCSADDFAQPKHYQPIELSARDWAVDEENVVATADKKTFSFSAPAGKMAGWVMLTKRDRLVVGYDYFADPVPINSKDDTVGVRPRVVVQRPGKGE